MTRPLESSFADELSGLYLDAVPQGFPRPELLFFHDALATELDLQKTKDRAAAIYSGNELLKGSRPIALAYAGHQFGSFNPQLGDGRAVLLGEARTNDGRLFDLQLKGSGATQFSRGGDGKAGLGPVLREALVSEAMFHLGVPTTRVLCALTTGESIQRQTQLPGAVLCRIAASHLRIGSFQYLAARGMFEQSEKLVHYTLRRHFPEHDFEEQPAVALLMCVARVQAELIAHWMSIGFVHGVMNTDNVALSGETIDYGPCAFMDIYHQDTVFSSIDRGGRYAYKNQPTIGKWNLARLAEALLPLMAESEDEAIEIAQQQLQQFSEHYNQQLLGHMRAKLGLIDERREDEELIAAVLTFFQDSQTDYTLAFRSLAKSLREQGTPEWGPIGQELSARYLDRLGGEALASVADRMDGVNPIYLARNHLVEEALEAAHEGELAPFLQLREVLKRPFEEQGQYEKYALPPPDDFGPYRTFCGT